MKINQIIVNESMGGTCAGAVATVESPMGSVQTRSPVKGLQPAEKVIKGKAKKKGPYQNSIVEGKMKDLDYDIKNMRPTEFQRKYGMKREDMLAKLQPKKPLPPVQTQPVQEAELQEDDLVIIPGQKNKRKTGFVAKGDSRVDHEVDMARSDLIASYKNAKAIFDMLKDRSEEEGIEGWVQEKLIKAADYLNAVKEYLDGKMAQESIPHGGVIAGGGVGEGVAEGSVLKSIKRGLQGWDKNAVGPSGEKLGNPKDIVKRAKAMDTDTAKKVRAGLDAASDHSPAGLQRRALDRKLKGVAEAQVNEKFASQQQAKLMYAVAGDKDVAKKTGVSQKVAKEFIKKSHGQKVKSLPKKVKKKD